MEATHWGGRESQASFQRVWIGLEEYQSANPTATCTYPGDGSGYADGTGCAGATTALVCTTALMGHRCQAGYTGTPEATCGTAGGVHSLSGCTRMSNTEHLGCVACMQGIPLPEASSTTHVCAICWTGSFMDMGVELARGNGGWQCLRDWCGMRKSHPPTQSTLARVSLPPRLLVLAHVVA